MNDYLDKDILVLGCGNVLFGDDGFGPAVVQHLEAHCDVPSHVGVRDVGMAVRDLLFTVALREQRPRLIIIVDAMDEGRPPGTLCERAIGEIPVTNIGAHSMHLQPTSTLLRELNTVCGIAVTVISVQVDHAPAEVCPGLSDVVRNAVPAACERVLELLDDRGHA